MRAGAIKAKSAFLSERISFNGIPPSGEIHLKQAADNPQPVRRIIAEERFGGAYAMSIASWS